MSLTVIGIGDDGIDGLSARARAHLADAELIVGSPRHLAMLPDAQQPYTHYLEQRPGR